MLAKRAHDAPPRVLIDATSLRTESGMRGIGRYIHDLLYGLAETRSRWSDSMEVCVLADLGWPRWSITKDLVGAAEEGMALRGTVGRSIAVRRRLFGQAVAHAAHASIVHVPEPFGTPLLGLVPRVVTCLDLIPLRFPREYIGGRVKQLRQLASDRVRFSTARRVVAISRRTRDDVRAILGVPESRIDVVPCGVHVERWLARDPVDEARRRAALKVGDRPYVVYVGYCDHRKNVPGMMAALAHARKSIDVDLVWGGDLPAWGPPHIEQIARDHGVWEHVRLLGFVQNEDLPALYRGAIAHLFISRLEGFGLTVAESMAAGVPVILAEASGSEEVGGDAAIAVDADDAASAGDAIVRLARDPEEHARRVAAGRVQVLGFTRERMALGYVESYGRALGLGAPIRP